MLLIATETLVEEDVLDLVNDVSDQPDQGRERVPTASAATRTKRDAPVTGENPPQKRQQPATPTSKSPLIKPPGPLLATQSKKASGAAPPVQQLTPPPGMPGAPPPAN